jgi:betaine-aldehyde dehydrogenase
MPVEDRLYIGGEWVAPEGTGVIEVISPATEEKVGQVPEGTTADIDKAVAAARTAFDGGEWTRMAHEERAQLLSSLSQTIQARSEEMAQLITNENGSPVSWGIMGQVFASTMVADFYAGLAKDYAFTEERAGVMGNKALVRKLPVGVVGGIVPWNVPLFTTMLKLAPAMVAGATMVLKPAPETPLDAQLLAEIAHEVGIPAGVLNVVPAGREVGEHLVTHPDVDKIAFTGSTAAGRRIAALCGERLRRVTLELGGKSASIILDDADLASAVATLVPAGTMNNGQACVAQTRILASRARYDEVVEAVAEAVGNLRVGDPLDPATEVGPLTAERQRERVEGYLAAGRDEGAKVVVGGGRPSSMTKGWYVEPTVFANVTNDMKIAREEIFGPVLSVIPYEDVDDAVRIANDTEYGLSGSVYGADVDTATEIAGRVRTGTTTVNGFMLEFGCPFGGFKGSGLGRELGPEGLEAYLELQSVSLPVG